MTPRPLVLPVAVLVVVPAQHVADLRFEQLLDHLLERQPDELRLDIVVASGDQFANLPARLVARWYSDSHGVVLWVAGPTNRFHPFFVHSKLWT